MIKKLARAIREYKKQTILTPIFVTLEVVMEVIIPLLMANLIDNGIYEGNMNSIYKTGFMLVVSAILSLVFGMFAGISASKATSGFAKNLRKDLYYSVQKFSFANIDKFSTSSIVTRLTTDVTNVKQSFQMIIRIAVRSPLMLIFSLIMAININPKLSLIFLVLIPFIALGLYLIIRKTYPIFEGVFKRYDDLNNVVEENVSGIRVVKSFVLEEKEKIKFNKVSDDIYTNFTRAEKIMALNAPLMQFGIYTAIILISWFGAKTIINSGMTTLTTGELTSLITYSIQVLSSLMMLSMVLVMITISRASMERIVELLNEVPDLRNPKKPIKTVANGDIEFDNVGFSYVKQKKKECLNNINIKINSGETIGIIGGTGSGKSTLVSLIPRLYDATEGTVKVGRNRCKKIRFKIS